MKARLFFMVILSGVSSVGAETVTWDNAITEAAKNNADLQSYQASLKAAEFESKAAFGAFLPEISGRLGYSRFNGGESSENSYSAALNAKQNFFAGFQDRARLDQAAAGRDLAEARLDATRAKVSYDLKSSYAGLFYAQESVKLAKDIQDRRDANLELVELRFQGGRENKGSYYLSKSSLSQARFDTLRANNFIDVGRQQLAKMLGRDEAAEFAVTGTVPVSNPGERPDFERLVPETPDHRQIVAQERIAEASLTIARSQFYPSLDFSGSVGRQGNDWFPGTTLWDASFALTIPLFKGGSDYYTAKAASSSLAAAFSNRQSTDRDVRARLKQAYVGYIEAVEKLNVDTEALEASTVRAEIARNKYNNGLLSFDDWDIIENELITRQKTALTSQRDRIIAEASWEQVQGKGVIP